MMRTDLHHDERLALPVAENALLWCMRAWVVGLHRDIDAERRIEDVLDRLGAPGAAGCLSGFMWALRHGAVRTIGVECACQPRVSADERALLGVFALAQEGQSLEAMLALRGLVSAPAARAAWLSAEGWPARCFAPGGGSRVRRSLRSATPSQAAPGRMAGCCTDAAM